ncbi:MAG TPA: hypothetical protein VFX53_05195 [Pedococcus sp.]|nr:hypothetical protein [Pedococcus sp.]
MTKPTRTRSEIGKANLAKSKATERAVAAYYRVSGWPGAERTVRTGYAVAGRRSGDRGDIDGTPGMVTQVKVVATATSAQVESWLADTEAQRLAAGADVGILIIKRPGHAHPAHWWAYVWLDTLVRLVGGTLRRPGAYPVRFELADLLWLLREVGYGTPLAAESGEEAS